MRHILLIAAVMCSYVGFAQLSAEQLVKKPNDDRSQERIAEHQAREKAREVRTANFAKHIDSLVLSHNFSFTPTSYQMQPAGSMRLTYNPNFKVSVYPDFVDIYVPYIKGITPPYYLTVINYTITSPKGYSAIQTDEGWTVSFKTNLFSINTYTFTFSIYSSTGETTLNISSDIYNTVTYSGSLMGHY